jgi:hypothetical protein
MDKEWCRNGHRMDKDQPGLNQTPGNGRNGQGILQEFRNGQGMDKESSRNGGGV